MMAASPPGWGTASRNLELRPTNVVSDGDLDNWLIAELIHTYAWGFDERRSELLRCCFTQDAVWHGTIGPDEPIEPVRGRDAIVSWLSGFWERQTDQRRHLIMSLSVDRMGDARAQATTSLLLTSVEAELALVLTSFYRFTLVKHEGTWLIEELFEGCDIPF